MGPWLRLLGHGGKTADKSFDILNGEH
jgi:hypothetical protein